MNRFHREYGSHIYSQENTTNRVGNDMLFQIPGSIPTKKNAYVRRNKKYGGKGLMIKKQVAADIQAIIWTLKSQAKGFSFGYRPVAINVRIWKDRTEIEVEECPDPQYRPQRRDIDNMTTTILDCLAGANIFCNDKQVVKMNVVSLIDKNIDT